LHASSEGLPRPGAARAGNQFGHPATFLIPGVACDVDSHREFAPRPCVGPPYIWHRSAWRM